MIPNLTWGDSGNWDTYVGAADQWDLAVVDLVDTFTVSLAEGVGDTAGILDLVDGLTITLAEDPADIVVALDRVESLIVSATEGVSEVIPITIVVGFDDFTISLAEIPCDLYPNAWEALPFLPAPPWGEVGGVSGSWSASAPVASPWGKTPSAEPSPWTEQVAISSIESPWIT